MVCERVLDVMGVPVRLSLSGAGVAALTAAVDVAWERCLRDAATAAPDTSHEPRTVAVVLDEDAEVISASRAEGAVAGSTEVVVMDELTTRLVREGLEAKVGDRWLLHACALADPTSGATVVLVAPSGTGKTTASRTLASTLGYVTDETAVVERDGSMTPFPKPLSLLVDGRRPKVQVSPQEWEMLPSPAAPWLARVALLARDPEVTGVRVEQVPTVEALAFLAEQTSSLHLLEQPLGTVAAMLAARGGLQRLVYSESAELAPLLAGWLADATPVGPVEVPVPSDVPTVAAAAASGDRPTLAAGRLRRAPVLDEFHEDGQSAVLLGGQIEGQAGGRVLALSAMASLLLLTIGDAGEAGMELTDLESYLEREVGVPEGMSVSDALSPLLDDLVANALLERA